MNTLQHRFGARALIIATMASFVLAACGTGTDQGPGAQTPSTTQLVQQSAREVSLETWPASTAEAPNIKSSFAIDY
jgi:hypothetical protein